MAKICNKCGSVSEDSMRFCINCGNEFAQAQVQMPEQPKVKRPIYEQTDYAAIDARNAAKQQPLQQAQPPVQQRPQPVQQMQYGQQMYAPAPQMQQPAPPKAPKKKNTTPIIVSIVAAVVVIGVALGVIFGIVLPNKEKDEDKDEKDKSSNSVSDVVSDEKFDFAVKLSDGKTYPAQKESVYVSAGSSHTVGLKSDGTVVATGINSYGEGDVSDWSDIIAVSAGHCYTVGLKNDGTVVAVGLNNNGQCDVGDWFDIVDVSAGSNHTVGLKSDGTVVAVGSNSGGKCNVDDWTDIVAVSAGQFHTVGLKSNGTVVATEYLGGENSDYGQCDVGSWKDIVSVSAGGQHTVGLKSDGTAIVIGPNSDGRCDVEEWTDIVAVSAGANHTIGLKSDGTVVAVGDNSSGQCNVDSWTNIVSISAKTHHTVGLKSDGTVVAIGLDGLGQCDVERWSGIKTPDFEELKNRVNGKDADNKTPDIVNPDVPSVDVTEPVTVPATEIVTEIVTERPTERPTKTPQERPTEAPTVKPTEPAKPPVSTDWKTAYSSYLKKLNNNKEEYNLNSDASFNLVYITDDDVPELLVSPGTYNAAKAKVVTFANGEVVEIGEFGYMGEISYVERGDILVDSRSSRGNSSGTVYRIGENGSTEKVVSYFSNAASGNELRYEINEETVSEEEFDARMSESYPENTVRTDVFSQPTLTSENIDKYCK